MKIPIKILAFFPIPIYLHQINSKYFDYNHCSSQGNYIKKLIEDFQQISIRDGKMLLFLTFFKWYFAPNKIEIQLHYFVRFNLNSQLLVVGRIFRDEILKVFFVGNWRGIL
jgi:hypothetical protein